MGCASSMPETGRPQQRSPSAKSPSANMYIGDLIQDPNGRVDALFRKSKSPKSVNQTVIDNYNPLHAPSQ